MTAFTKKKWRKRYSELRKLLHNPELAVSGGFARIHADTGEFIYNAHSGRVIARISEGACKLQGKSLYNDVLKLHVQSAPEQPFVTGDIQSNVVKQVGHWLTRKETPHVRTTQPVPKQPAPDGPRLQFTTDSLGDAVYRYIELDNADGTFGWNVNG